MSSFAGEPSAPILLGFPLYRGLRRTLLALIAEQRRDFPKIGGFAQLTTLTASGIGQSILAHDP
jgi:hypothetical protein